MKSYNDQVGIGQQGIDNGNVRDRNLQFATQINNQTAQESDEAARQSQSFQAAQKNTAIAQQHQNQQQQMEQQNMQSEETHRATEATLKAKEISDAEAKTAADAAAKTAAANDPDTIKLKKNKVTQSDLDIESKRAEIAKATREQKAADEADLKQQHMAQFITDTHFGTPAGPDGTPGTPGDDEATTAMTIAKITKDPKDLMHALGVMKSDAHYATAEAQKAAIVKAEDNARTFQQNIETERNAREAAKFKSWTDYIGTKDKRLADKEDSELFKQVSAQVIHELTEARKTNPDVPLPGQVSTGWKDEKGNLVPGSAEYDYQHRVDELFKEAKKAKEKLAQSGNQPVKPSTGSSPFSTNDPGDENVGE